jgi:hypothetical protein
MATVCPGRTFSGIQLDLMRDVRVSTGVAMVSRGKACRQRVIFGSGISILQYGALIGLRRVTAVEAEKTGINRRRPLWKRLQAGGDLLVRKQ